LKWRNAMNNLTNRVLLLALTAGMFAVTRDALAQTMPASPRPARHKCRVHRPVAPLIHRRLGDEVFN
jgi:hypothetical protein